MKPFSRIDASVTLHTIAGAFTMTVENAPGPESPDSLGAYIAEKVQGQYDTIRATQSAPPTAELEALREKVAQLQSQLASKPRRGRPPKKAFGYDS